MVRCAAKPSAFFLCVLTSLHVFPLWGAESQSVSGQMEPSIALDPAIECWYHSQFPVLGAEVIPPEGIVRSRLYFRCSLYPDYYFVDLATEDGVFRGVAPQAEESCPQVHYYVEAVASDFTSTRTEERVVDVTSENECRRRYPAAGWFAGSDPRMYVGSTVAGPNLAPGFKGIGIAGFITSAGATIAAAGSGGSSAAVVAGVAAAGGAAAGLGVLASGGSSSNSSTTTSAVVAGPPPTSTSAPVTTSSPPQQSLKACFAMKPADGIIGVNEALTIDGRCSEGGSNLNFRFDLGDGRIKEGQPFITAVWSQPGTYNVILTVTRPDTARLEEDSFSRRVRVEPAAEPVVASFTGSALPDTCRATFDGTSSSGDIVDYLWELDADNDFGQGVVTDQGPVVHYDWGRGCFTNTPGVLVVRLTVVGREGDQDTLEQTVHLFTTLRRLDSSQSVLSSSVTTELRDSNGRGASGQVVFGGGETQGIQGDGPSLLRYTGRAGRLSLEGILPVTLDSPALWRFDFSAAPHFVPGSLRVVTGQEVSREGYAVVLRLGGNAGERVRIEYELAR
jgi:hypothetical protein